VAEADALGFFRQIEDAMPRKRAIGAGKRRVGRRDRAVADVAKAANSPGDQVAVAPGTAIEFRLVKA
jgi:hypothetical protein